MLHGVDVSFCRPVPSTWSRPPFGLRVHDTNVMDDADDPL